MRISDWSSDVCSSDLSRARRRRQPAGRARGLMSRQREKPVAELTPNRARLEHARLEEEIAAHDRRYHQEDAPTVADADYDALKRRLLAIEEIGKAHV